MAVTSGPPRRFALQPEVVRLAHGRVLVGGAPPRLVRLTAAGAVALDALITGGAAPTPAAAALARRLVAADLLRPLTMPRPEREGEVTVCIPSRNGARRLPGLLVRLAGADVVVVDDGSTDATAAVALGAGARVVRRLRSGRPRGRPQRGPARGPDAAGRLPRRRLPARARMARAAPRAPGRPGCGRGGPARHGRQRRGPARALRAGLLAAGPRATGRPGRSGPACGLRAGRRAARAPRVRPRRRRLQRGAAIRRGRRPLLAAGRRWMDGALRARRAGRPRGARRAGGARPPAVPVRDLRRPARHASSAPCRAAACGPAHGSHRGAGPRRPARPRGSVRGGRRVDAGPRDAGRHRPAGGGRAGSRRAAAVVRQAGRAVRREWLPLALLAAAASPRARRGLALTAGADLVASGGRARAPSPCRPTRSCACSTSRVRRGGVAGCLRHRTAAPLCPALRGRDAESEGGRRAAGAAAPAQRTLAAHRGTGG